MKDILRIGITIGDPAGIGPEVSVKGLDIIGPNIIPVLIGRSDVIEFYFPDRIKEFILIDEDHFHEAVPGRKYIHHVPVDFPLMRPGCGGPETGSESREYIDTAVKLWKKGCIDALVTAPVNKGLIEKSGTPFTGHTEYLAALINENSPYMMMYSEKYRVILSTTHVPVSSVTDSLDPHRLDRVIEAAWNSMKSIDGGDVRIAVAGLDPHCGDNGSIGFFDSDVTLPAVERARRKGYTVDGPFSADSVFIPGNWEKYNIVVAQYHDQGLIPFKVLCFDTGVNVTLGLSLTRTSADHGTAFDIAGKNMAKYSSMAGAVDLAYRLEMGRRNKHIAL